MNRRVRTYYFVLFTALFCGLRAADVKSDNTPTPKVIELLTTKSRCADIALMTLLVPKACNAILFKRDYASAIFLASAAVLRKDSLIDTCKFVSGCSGNGLSAYSSCLYANPTTTLAVTAMALTGAYILGGYVNDWWQRVKFKQYLSFGLNCSTNN